MDVSTKETPNRPDWFTKLDEWKECRNTIGRLDTITSDLRRYSFSLVTALITATGLLGQGKATPATAEAVPVAIMILIVALFAVDRYYTLLLNAAVERGLDLEGGQIDKKDLTNDALTQVISVYAIDSGSVIIAPLLYIGLLVATRILALVMSDQGIPRRLVNPLFWWCVVLVVAYFLYTELRRPTGFFRRNRLRP